MTDYYYDYQQVPLSVADEAFRDFYHNIEFISILDLLNDLIEHCNRWCDENQAFSEEDHREPVIRKLQAYLHERYSNELMELLELEIIKNREKIERMIDVQQRKN
ncbi:MAG: hypothetical protein KDJ52_23225 [Anaerolineae bacterium]|nr:hypothetical protein [Anaerolineae bacterium]